MEDPAWLSNIIEDILKLNEELAVPEEEMSEVFKRSVEVPQTVDNRTVMPSSCRREVWQCMSGVLERGVRWVDRPQEIYSSLQPVLYKAVFHGGVKSMWTSVMEVNI